MNTSNEFSSSSTQRIPRLRFGRHGDFTCFKWKKPTLVGSTEGPSSLDLESEMFDHFSREKAPFNKFIDPSLIAPLEGTRESCGHRSVSLRKSGSSSFTKIKAEAETLSLSRKPYPLGSKNSMSLVDRTETLQWEAVVAALNRVAISRAPVPLRVDNCELPPPSHYENSNNENPIVNLRSASARGDDEAIKKIVKGLEGSKVLEMDSMALGPSALHIASDMGCQKAVSTLLWAGALVGVKCVETGCMPLHVACGHGHLSIVKQLVAHGASLDDKSACGKTPLHMAVQATSHACEVVLLLLQEIGERGTKAAIQGLNLKIVGMRTVEEMGRSARKHAQEALVNIVDNQGVSALHEACRIGNLRVVSALLAAGAKTELRTRGSRRTAAEIAYENKHLDVANAVNDYAAAAGSADWVHGSLRLISGDSTPNNQQVKFGFLS